MDNVSDHAEISNITDKALIWSAVMPTVASTIFCLETQPQEMCRLPASWHTSSLASTEISILSLNPKPSSDMQPYPKPRPNMQP